MKLWNDVDLPFSFTVGRYGSRLNYPTFAQFGVSPRYKWMTLHLGYRNLTFSPYTLVGHTFLGAGIELNPGRFRFAAMYGRMRNAAEVDTSRTYVLPAFKRIGYGIKIGYGTSESYIDLIFFGGKDDENSLKKESAIGITPSRNTVLGLSAQLAIASSVQFKVDVGGSIFTRNINALQSLSDSIEEKLNKYIPDPFGQPNATSRFNLAGKTSIAWISPAHKLGLAYERIDPAYETMGAYFFANDLERYTVEPAFFLWSNKVRIQGAVGIQRNNLLGNRLESNHRTIASANADIAPSSKWGIYGNYSNYAFYQKSGTVEINDTLAFNMQTQSFTLMPRLMITGQRVIQNWLLNVMHQASTQDAKAVFENSYRFESTYLSLSDNLVFPASTCMLQIALNGHRFRTGDTENVLAGGTIGIQKSLANKKLSMHFSATVNKKWLDSAADGYSSTFLFTGSYKPDKHHVFYVQANLLSTFGNSAKEFSEYRVMLSYSYNFSK